MLPETNHTRRQRWFSIKQQYCEVVIIGAGVVGATIYRRLSEAGYMAVLIDRHDVGGGASQGSANLIWGGLLYLAKGRLDEVVRWSRARDALLAQPGVTPLTCSYRFDPRQRHPALVRTALFAYWLLGGCRGPRPHNQHGAVHFREALLAVPDARWTWQQLAAVPNQSQIVTWSRIEAISGTATANGWQLDVHDLLDGLTTSLHTTLVINAAGAWAGTVDALAGIDHGWDIIASRGVSLVLADSDERVEPLNVIKNTTRNAVMVEHPRERDILSLVPFPGADASIWGSTETLTSSADDALVPTEADVVELIRLHRQLIGPLPKERILAVRCGLRALAVRRGVVPQRSQDLTRRFRLLSSRPGWVTIIGGKLTGSDAIARRVVAKAAQQLGPRTPRTPVPGSPSENAIPMIRYPGIPAGVVDPEWCRDHEHCWTLACWLRRRTAIAQVIPRGGLGQQDEHRQRLEAIARVFHGDDAVAVVADYARQIALSDERLNAAWKSAQGPVPLNHPCPSITR